MVYSECFKQHYSKRFSDMSVSFLLKYENNLSELIDSDLFSDLLLADEVMVLYELIRNECVKRLAICNV